MHAYLGLNRKLFEAVNDNADSNVWLAQVQERLNHIFQVFRTVERTLLDHRQRLAEIEACALTAMEALPEDDPSYTTLQEISEKASHRL